MTEQLSTQPYKGTRDFYPEDMRFRRWMFGHLRTGVESFGYQEYDGPMLEPFELYAAKTGQEIVNQQLYWLMDRGDRKLAVRPEMTPTLARLVAQRFHELPRPVRLYSIPNLWRYERPQKGRLREHWQLNVDVLGGDPILADAEVLSVAIDLMRRFGGEKFIEVRVNNRRLIDHFFKEKLALSAEVALQATKALDAKDKISAEAYQEWLRKIGLTEDQQVAMEKFFSSDFETIASTYPCAGTQELSGLFQLMRESGAGDRVVFDPTVLRGMDYYTGTVFEIYDISPENRRAMFGGGRYDNLLGLFGNYQLPGVGFGMGDVTLQAFLEIHGLTPKFEAPIDVFVSLPKLELRPLAETCVQACRAMGLKTLTPLAEGGFGAQLKLASKHGARFAVLFGDRELAEGKLLLKDLQSGEQIAVQKSEVATEILNRKNAPAR